MSDIEICRIPFADVKMCVINTLNNKCIKNIIDLLKCFVSPLTVLVTVKYSKIKWVRNKRFRNLSCHTKSNIE